MPSNEKTINSTIGIDYQARKDQWRARLRFGGKTFLIGYFERPEDAFRASEKGKMIIKKHILEIGNDVIELKKSLGIKQR